MGPPVCHANTGRAPPVRNRGSARGSSLKPPHLATDPEDMAKGDQSCPVCDAELIFAGDEHPGDQVVCSYCGAPFLLTKRAEHEKDWEVEEDF